MRVANDTFQSNSECEWVNDFLRLEEECVKNIYCHQSFGPAIVEICPSEFFTRGPLGKYTSGLKHSEDSGNEISLV